MSWRSVYKPRSKREAVAYARFFEELRRKGFYHPGSGFFVSHDSGGKPSVVAVMPRLKPSEEHDAETARLQMIPFRVLGVAVNLEDLSDPSLEFNYGCDRGKVYCFDLHVFKSDSFRKRVLAWHCGLPEQRNGFKRVAQH